MSIFSTEEPHGLSQLQTLVNRNQVQALKTTGAQPRPGNHSPNPIASQASLTAPQHVSSVQVRQQKTSDVSTRCTVTFQRNPADQNFVETRVFVSGYKGNPSPVQVGSGQSPVSFSLENTGEPVTVTVQASGSLGNAPLSTAPTTTMQLVKTPLATTPTAAGNGTATSTPSVVQVAVKTLSTSDLVNLTTTPVVIVPAPGAGKVIVPVALTMEYIYGGTAFGATGAMCFFYGITINSNLAFEQRNSQNFIDQASSQFANSTPYYTPASLGAAKSVADNSAISVGNPGAAINTGNGSVRFTALYYVADSV